MRKSLKRTRRLTPSTYSWPFRQLTARLSAFAALCTGFAALTQNETASATEAAFGRYIPGIYAGPGIDIVPPVPGFYWGSSTAYYAASAGKSLSLPFGGALRTDVKASMLLQGLSAVWVPDIKLGEGVTIGFGITVPVAHVGASASLGRARIKDTADGLGDIVFMPVMIGYQNGGHFVSFTVAVTAPTGVYRKGDLANIGMNYWTVTPTIAYMYLNPETKWQFSTVVGVDFNTKNNDTNYTSGAMFHLDTTLVKNFDNGIGIGVFGSILYQLQDDKGPLANRLNGFKGRSFAVGPMIKYTYGKGIEAINFSLNWAPEFGVKNRMKGNAVYLTAAGRF